MEGCRHSWGQTALGRSLENGSGHSHHGAHFALYIATTKNDEGLVAFSRASAARISTLVTNTARTVAVGVHGVFWGSLWGLWGSHRRPKELVTLARDDTANGWHGAYGSAV